MGNPPDLYLKPLVAQKAVTLIPAVACRQPDPFFDRAPPALPGDRQGMMVVSEKILHHLPLQNVLEDLRRDFPRDQTLPQNPNGDGVQIVP